MVRTETKRLAARWPVGVGPLLMVILLLAGCSDRQDEAANTPAAPVASSPTALAPTPPEVTVAPTQAPTQAAMVTPTEVTSSTTAVTAAPVPVAARVTELMDYQVTSTSGQNLGQVEDVIAGLQQNQLNYAVLSFEHSAGGSDKLFAVPLAVLQPNPTAETLVFSATDEVFSTAPSFTRDNWPKMADASWDDELLSFWATTGEPALLPETGTMPGTAANGPAAVRASALLNDRVRNSNGDDLGEIKDLILNLDRPGETAVPASYAVVSFNGFAGLEDKLFAVPLNRLTLDPAGSSVTFDAAAQALQNAPAFSEDDWPDFTDPAWDEAIAAFWENSDIAAPGATADQDTGKAG